MKNLVSIIIPFKEDRGWLKEAVASVEKQDYPDIELILAQGDKYRGGNCNDGIRKAKGEFIKLLDEDDWLHPEFVSMYVKAFSQPIMKDVDFIHGNAYYCGEEMMVYRPPNKLPTFETLKYHNVICNPSVMYRSRIFKKVGHFNPMLFRSEDFDFHLRAMKLACKIGYINASLVYYRIHENQVSGAKADRKARAEIRNQIIRTHDSNKVKRGLGKSIVSGIRNYLRLD